MLDPKGKVPLSQVNMHRIGWSLWFFQNCLVLFLPILLLAINFNQLISSTASNQKIASVFILILFLVLILDITASALISGYLLHIFRKKKLGSFSGKYLIIPMVGCLWIMFSLLWRIPFLLNLEMDNNQYLGLSKLFMNNSLFSLIFSYFYYFNYYGWFMLLYL
ncbi:MAG: hypothetical protein ACFFBD_25350, partial [Candidatus Hodarchaeota archaeon]